MQEAKIALMGVASEENDVVEHPLYAAQPAAGFPSPGDDLVEQPLDLNDLMIDNPTSTLPGTVPEPFSCVGLH